MGACGSRMSGAIVVPLSTGLITGGGTVTATTGVVTPVPVGSVTGGAEAAVVVDAFGLVMVPLTSLPRHSWPGRYNRAGLRASAGGAGQSWNGVPSSAASVYSFQIFSG